MTLCTIPRVFFFFFSSRRRHTRFKCDWSSDVCSSDLTLRERFFLSSESFDRSTPTPVLLVGVDFGFPHFDGELEELGLLAGTAGLRPVARLTCKPKVPHPALFVGSAKAAEIPTPPQMP